MSLRAWLAFRFSMLLLGAMALFVLGLFFARQAGARGEAAALAQERARLAQLFLRQTSLAGAPITVRERQGDSLPSAHRTHQASPILTATPPRAGNPVLIARSNQNCAGSRTSSGYSART